MSDNICIKDVLGNGEGVIVTNVDFEENYSKIKSFAIVLIFFQGKEKYEVIKYDFSEKENFNVHYNYLKKQKKIFIEKEVSVEDIIKIKQEITINWRKLVLKYKQNNYI